MTLSGIYEGSIRHRRIDPPTEFRHRIALAYLDLDELPGLLGGRLADGRRGLLRFRRADYLGNPDTPLRDAVLNLVAESTGERLEGPVRVLTQLRSFGHCFNPVSFYYCFASDGEQLRAVVAEVTNTPWGERHSYVVGAPARQTGPTTVSGAFDKALHVSPFMGMDHRYQARFGVPAETLSVHIDSSQNGARAFDATLSLRRRELTHRSISSLTIRYPFATLRVLALIYGHAVGLKLGGARWHQHPKTLARGT
ncbi:MAG: DUF1365 domain-containing protein [Solirubrobacteraceae bacterium]